MLYVTLRQVEYVAAVARAGGLSAAAALLHVSQPSLSVALAQVEARLGQPLFLRRKGARLGLTPFGERYVAEAEALLAQARRLEDPTALRRAVEGRLSLGCFEDLAPRYLAPMLTRLREDLPGVEIRWRVAGFEALAREMLEGRVDLALTYDLGLDASFERTVVGEAVPHAFVATGHSLAGEGEVALAVLARESLILFEEGLSIRHVLSLFRAVGATPAVRHRAGSLEVMRSLAAHGEGVGISYTVPPSQLSYDGAGVVAIPIADPAAREPVIFARPSTLSSPEVVALAHRTLRGLLQSGQDGADKSS